MSRPFRKKYQTAVELDNNRIVRRHALYVHYDSGFELEILYELRVSVLPRLIDFFAIRKVCDPTTASHGHR